MKKYTLISLFILVVLSLIPPIEIILRNPQYKYWLWMVLTAGFAGIFTIFIKTNPMVKIIAIGTFIDCFFSAAPYISFTSYCSIILCCYFYISCTRIEDWKLVFKAGQAILILNVLLLTLEFFHKDSLLDFGESYVTNFGVLGHHMQMGSFAVIIAAFLLPFSTLNIWFPIIVSIFAKSTWTFFCAGAGLFTWTYFQYPKRKNVPAILLIIFLAIFSVWSIKAHKISDNFSKLSGRTEVWQKSIYLANKHPFVGWGPGSYKELFAPLSRMQCIPYKTAHNFIAELLFEVGYPLTGAVLVGLGWLCFALWRARQWLLLSGLVMMITDGLVHFPDRQIQCVPIIIMFLAYCAVCLEKDKTCQIHSSPS